MHTLKRERESERESEREQERERARALTVDQERDSSRAAATQNSPPPVRAGLTWQLLVMKQGVLSYSAGHFPPTTQGMKH